MIHVSLIQTTDAYYLLGDGDNIAGFETEQRGLQYYEEGYRRYHARGYEASMSALLNNISFSPSIVSFNDLDELVEKLFDGRTTELTRKRLSNVSGMMIVYDINQENGKALWEQGRKPSLI